MAIGTVSFIRKDGNLTPTSVGNDHISGLIFNLPVETQMPPSIKIGDVIQLFPLMSDWIRYHWIWARKNNFFTVSLFSHLEFFVWNRMDRCTWCSRLSKTERYQDHPIRSEWRHQATRGYGHLKTFRSTASSSEDDYSLNLVSDINTVAEELANEHRPLSVLLTGNASSADSTGAVKTIDLKKIPSCIGDFPRVTALLGQGRSDLLRQMQIANPKHSSIGCVGVALGCVAEAKVCESIAWVNQFNLTSKHMSDIEFGFGNIELNDTGDDFISMLQFEALSPAQIDEIEEKGYVFPIKYAGRANGTYFSKDRTCSDSDYRTIARNRTIDKSRRAIRNALLPYLNSPVLVNPKTGYLAEIENKKIPECCQEHPKHDGRQ